MIQVLPSLYRKTIHPSIRYYLFILLFCCGAPCILYAQTVANDSAHTSIHASTDSVPTNALFVINEINVSGNKKTRYSTIARELPFQKGDSLTLPALAASFRRAKELLFNTRLFNDVVVALKSIHGYAVDIEVTVRERWYLFPVPYFRPVDRNFSAWGEEHYSLARVNYGLKFLHSNFTGRNDRLRIWLLTGYTRQVQLNYDQPAADKSLKHGFGFGVQYAALKEINISTVDNLQKFVNRDTIAGAHRYLQQQASASLNYFYRPALTTRHVLRFSLNYLHEDSVVAAINPHYLPSGAGHLLYPELSYALEYQKVDYVAYVLNGIMGDLTLMHRGISAGMNLTQLTGRFTGGLPLGAGFYAGLQGYGVVKVPFEQPYFNQRMFGYGDVYLRGLEQYVIDGVAGSLLRTTLRKHCFSFSVNGGRIPTLPRIPFGIFAKVFSDLGYAYNKDNTANSLVNRPLYTAGAGIDVVSAYDFVFRCEYSINQLGHAGIFFHLRNDF